MPTTLPGARRGRHRADLSGMNSRQLHSVAATVLATVAALVAAGAVWGTGVDHSKPTSAPAPAASALAV